ASSWSWDFGDGGTSTEQNPTHTYIAMGNYTVTLTATNQFGSDTEIKTNYITGTAPQPPIADFTASATDINIGNSVTFTDLSLENPTSWSWSFKGGTPTTSTEQNPTVTYNTVGTFDVTLVATNAQGSDTETKVDYITVSVKPYCTSSASSQSYEYIAGVQVADLDNASGPSPYSDFTHLVAHVARGETVNVSLTPGFTGTAYNEYWKTWIDYNDDHDFEDAGEEVFSGSGSSVVTGNFTVPASAIIGNTRMRVSMSYSTYPPMCGVFTYGEVEDYTVNITCMGTAAVINPGFETGFNPWTPVGDVSLIIDPPGSGNHVVRLDSGGSSIEQQVFDLCPNTSYTVSCWGKAKASANIFLGVKDYGGAEQTVQFTDEDNFVQKSITFITGAANTSVTIFFIKSGPNSHKGIADDFEIIKN
ncbi:MAG: PKD domain-containing protein, partial [Candidatus Aminicenantes bacterium]|nr:PKD domain-containing protein [Candidatus Aminicenantes bacterium]NIM81857.1 PKD domain-containing protein [Candidatus Aminicenantes bacterium]NIN21234.1 PKD domain-containing protein [Candidatus Aminicenantes bacterium]NIN45055.1 PKD domain-containing protein [Candidatus Aminicenantes bacterium]NIN87872.1 PKD domain-containing protein [Candidatus Aminicenantes bacterium]